MKDAKDTTPLKTTVKNALTGTIYHFACMHYKNARWVYSQRKSNYADLSFTDAKVSSISIVGVIV